MFRYFTHANTRRYLDVLDNLLYSYNNTYHRLIGMALVEVGPHNEEEVRSRLYPPKLKSHKWKLDMGDRVCLAIQRQPFRKGYLGSWLEEISEVASRLPTTPTPVTYKLRDLAGELIKGRFYEYEVQKVSKSDAEQFHIDCILKTRKDGGKIQYLMSLNGYPTKFDSWVDEIRPH